ncbi:MAG TPA: rod shape-determining protein MreC [Candidatus Paceibacterota bacterium]|nr:rod shape-determining protein MreC [Candidatus Paceibacterota bacterium]
MMMTSPSRRRQTQGSRVRFALYAALFLIVFGILFLWREPLSGVLWRALGPAMSAREGAAAATGGFFERFIGSKALESEVAQLRAQLASTSILLADRELLYAQNADLKARLGRHASSSAPVLAAVIMRPPATPYDTLMLDAGSGEGVKEGDLVSAGGSVYIGRVSQAYPTASRATLFSAPGESHEALLVARNASSSVPFALVGQGGGSMTGEVPAGTAVSAGDEVTFPSMDLRYTGRVTAVDAAAERSFKTVYVELPVNPFTLTFVEIRHAP